MAYEEAIITVTGLDCADCAHHVQEGVRSLPGVSDAQLNFTTARLKVRFDPERVTLEAIYEEIQRFGYGIKREGSESEPLGNHWEFLVEGLTSTDDAARLTAGLDSLPDVQEVSLNLATGVLRVIAKPGMGPEGIQHAIRHLGYRAQLQAATQPGPLPWWGQNRVLITGFSGLALLVGTILTLTGLPLGAKVFYAIAILVGAVPIAKAAYAALKTSYFLDLNALMVIAIIGAIAIDKWEEAATIVFLFALGNLLQSTTMDRTRDALRKLMGLIPNTAAVRRGEAEQMVPIESIGIGETLIIRPGDRIPLDGEVTAGASNVDEAPITGESLPVYKSAGATVYAGSINSNGSMEIKVTHTYRDTTFARIVHLVEEAQSQRAASQQLVDRFARIYTPGVIGIAVLISTLPPIFFNQPFAHWFYQALALLVVSCPCSLVISTPVAIAAAIGGATRQGVLFKGGAFLENLGRVQVMAFDKTGTLTQGKPEVTDVLTTNSLNENELLEIAAALEARSEHPLGDAIIRKCQVPKLNVYDFEAIPGRGVKGMIDGILYYVGSPRLFEGQPFPDGLDAALAAWQTDGKTAILVGNTREILGAIALADTIRPESREAIQELRRRGIRQIVMLTGDNEGTARRICQDLELDRYYSDLLPDDKVRVIQELMETHGHVAMVGDGINDAPALATATVGIAMGAAGTDIALEVADVALMNDDLRALAPAVALSRKTVGIITQNIVLSILVKGTLILLAFPGWLTLWLAVIGDVGTSLVVTLNGMRLLSYKRPT